MMKRVRRVFSAPVLLAFAIVGLGMVGTAVPSMVKPADRVFAGLHGYSDDYIGYVSYIKEGMYGRWAMAIRSLPPPQTITPVHLVYVAIGKVAALVGMDAPGAYAASRIFLGAAFILVSYALFGVLLKNRKDALTATFLAFVVSSVGWYQQAGSGWQYVALSAFGFTDNVTGRATSRPHYLSGAILFVCLVIFLIRPPVRRFRVGALIAAIAAFFLGIIHPSFAVLLFATVVLSTLVECWVARRISESVKGGVMVIAGLVIGLLLSYWSIQQYPFTAVLSFESYVIQEQFSWSRLIGDYIAFGPLLWVGLPGLVIGLFTVRGKKPQVFMLFWILMQLLLFFVLYPLFRAERFRFIQSLYFLPTAYGTVYLLRAAQERLKKPIVIVGTLLLILVTSSSYIEGMKQSVFSWTEYKDFSIMPFPPLTQMEAYAFLDKKTPRESTVLASWEAANHILIYSHNYVVGNTQGWNKNDGDAMVAAKNRFLTGSMPAADASAYLKAANISYIYYGYQERSLGNITQYPFLAKVFENKEVAIYEVRL
jgi:hypothetical protein